MPITYYKPADILAELLVQAGQGSNIVNGTPAGTWPVFANAESDSPDEIVSICDSTGMQQARDSITGKVEGPSGFQLRVRAATSQAAYDKCKSLYEYLSRTLYRRGVSIGSRYYLVQCCEGFRDIIDLGKEAPNSRRSICVFNAMLVYKDQTP